jgi:hypothetical protein
MAGFSLHILPINLVPAKLDSPIAKKTANPAPVYIKPTKPCPACQAKPQLANLPPIACDYSAVMKN